MPIPAMEREVCLCCVDTLLVLGGVNDVTAFCSMAIASKNNRSRVMVLICADCKVMRGAEEEETNTKGMVWTRIGGGAR